jgi:hypothetical protein
MALHAARVRARTRRGQALLGLLLACACGSAEEPGEGAPPAAPAASQPAAGANQPPLLRALRFDPDPPRPGEKVSVRVEASDPEGAPVRLVYAWRWDGERAGAGEAAFAVPKDGKGRVLEVEVRAHDGESQSAPLGARSEVGNSPPQMLELVLEPAKELAAGDTVVASPRAQDPDGDPLQFSYTWLVNGKPVPEQGPMLQPPHFRRGDSIALEVEASDGEDESEPLRAPELRVVNSPPVFKSQPKGLEPDGTFRYTPAIEDLDGDRRLRFRLVSAPKGMTIDWLRGAVAWRPGEDQEGRHQVAIEVDDLEGGVATQSFHVDVAFEKPAPRQDPAAPEL